jgi:hypothetical protein
MRSKMRPEHVVLAILFLTAGVWIIYMAIVRTPPTPKSSSDASAGPEKTLDRQLEEELIKRERPEPRCVLFVDVLGFSALTEEHPDDIEWDFGSAEISAATSPTSRQIGGFQHALNTLAEAVGDASSPSHVMAFSDCAFLVYNNPLQAALSATRLMQYFFRVHVPVRMGLAHGTWHVHRFSFDVVDSKTITRAVFYGSAVVRAHNGERHGGKGCRIFVHPSISVDAIAQIQARVRVLAIDGAHADAPSELNFLFEDELDELAFDNDEKHLLAPLRRMRDRLPTSAPPTVTIQYKSTFDALNRMRQQSSRPLFTAF